MLMTLVPELILYTCLPDLKRCWQHLPEVGLNFLRPTSHYPKLRPGLDVLLLFGLGLVSATDAMFKRGTTANNTVPYQLVVAFKPAWISLLSM